MLKLISLILSTTFLFITSLAHYKKEKNHLISKPIALIPPTLGEGLLKPKTLSFKLSSGRNSKFPMTQVPHDLIPKPVEGHTSLGGIDIEERIAEVQSYLPYVTHHRRALDGGYQIERERGFVV